jgi:putative ABC transport system permease protein
MIGVAVKGLLGRKTRALLTALAIILGVSMVSGTYVLTDTINKAFTGVLVSTYENTSAVISGKEVVKGAAAGNATVSEQLLAQVRALPDVQAAAGGILNFNGTTDLVKLIGENGKTIGGKGGAPTFGFGLDSKYPQFNPMKLVSGTWATGPGQVVVEQGTASKHGLHVGSKVGVSADGPTRPYTITGIAKLGSVSTIGAATIAVFDVATAQKLLHKPGQLDVISVAGKSGVSDKRLVRELAPLLPSNAQVETGSEQGKKEAKNITSGLSFIKYLLLAFAGIALFVGSFVIFNTIAITVAQRAREFATLRTLGASRRQVLRSVLIEAFGIGLLGAVIGLFLGLAIAKGLNAIFVALGADLPQTGLVFATRTVVVSLLAGVIVTVLAGIFPAVQATRVPPIAAVREGAVLPRSRLSRWSAWIAGGLLVLALALLADGLFLAKGIAGVLLPLGVGTLLLFIGIALVSGRLVKPLAAVVGSPARRAGGTPGRLASENSIRNPGRTANTAAALMIGLALITFVATLGKGLKASDIAPLKDQVRSDYVATASVHGLADGSGTQRATFSSVSWSCSRFPRVSPERRSSSAALTPSLASARAALYAAPPSLASTWPPRLTTRSTSASPATTITASRLSPGSDS